MSHLSSEDFPIPKIPLSQFITKEYIKDYICPVCKGIYWNPVVDRCGHVFCEKCYQHEKKSNQKCPISKEEFGPSPTVVPVLLQFIEKQIIYCNNKQKGCEWKGMVKDLEEHLSNSCLKEDKICPYDNCGQYIMKEKMDEHKDNCKYRLEKCKECNEEIESYKLKDHQLSCLVVKENLMKQGANGVNCIISDKEDNKLSPIYNSIIDKEISEVNWEILDSSNLTDSELEQVIHYVVREINTMNSKLMKLAKIVKALKKKKMEKINKSFLDGNNLNNFSTIIKNHDKKVGNTKDIKSISKNSKIMFIKKRSRPFNDDPIIIKNELSQKCLEEQKSTTSQDSSKTKDIQFSQPKINFYQEKETSIYDRNNLNGQIVITGSVAKFISGKKAQHKFLFGSQNINVTGTSPTTWTVKLLSNSKWIAIGLCDKKKVYSNNGHFMSNSLDFNHGSFVISSNGYTWNCQNSEEDNHAVIIPEMEKCSEIKLTYDPKKRTLIFSGTETVTLTQVFPVTYSYKELTPCIVFLNNGDSIQMSFEN